MASLKDINSSIEEGNEDLEKLNKNFAKWFASQKTSGDDLEAAAERRNRKVKAAGGGVTNIFNKTEKKGGLGLPGGLLTKAAIAAVVAAAIAAALEYLKRNDKDPRKNLEDGTFGENYANPASSPFTGSTVRQALNKINSQKARLKIANARLAGQLRTANNKIKMQAGLIDDLENPKKGRVIRTESRQDIKNRVRSDAPDKLPKTNARINNSLQRGGKTAMTASGQKIFNNAKLVKGPDGKSRFTALTDVEKAQFQKNKIAIQNKVAAGTAAKTGARLGALKINTAMVNMFTNIAAEFKASVAGAKAMPRPGFGWPNGQAYGQAIMDYLQGKTPAGVQKMLKWLFHPKILGLGFSILSIFEIALIWQHKKLHLTKILPGGEPAITDHKYTLAEQIAGTAALITGLGAAMIGAALGGVIGFAAFGPPGSFAGSLIGGYLAYQQMSYIIQFLYDLAMRKNLRMHGHLINSYKLTAGKTVEEANIITNNAALNDIEKDSKGFAAQGMFGTGAGVESRRINAVKEIANKMGVSTNFQNAAYSDKRNMQDSQRGNTRNGAEVIRGKGSSGIASVAAGLINAGLNLLGFGSAGASEMSTPGVTGALAELSNQKGAGMIRRGSGAEPPVSVTANSGNTTSSVTTVLSGGNGLNTIDTYVLQPGFNISHSMYTGSSRGQYN